ALLDPRAGGAPPRQQRLRGDLRDRPRPNGRRQGGGERHDRPALRALPDERNRGLYALQRLRRSPHQRDRRRAQLGGIALLSSCRLRVELLPQGPLPGPFGAGEGTATPLTTPPDWCERSLKNSFLGLRSPQNRFFGLRMSKKRSWGPSKPQKLF